MFPAKIYVGQIAVVLGIVVVSTWGATQWTAAALGYQQRLGEPWFLIVGYPVYLPWRLFEWWFAFEAYAPEIFEEGGGIAAGGGIAGALFTIVNSVWRARQSQLVTTYGSARWASPKEIKAAGLEPTRAGYINAIQVYPWTEGALYRLYASPEKVSTIALQPGEELIDVSTGDTVRWVVGDTSSGQGSSRRVHILVKPTLPDIQTNLVVLTDRRAYTEIRDPNLS